mmetsp:Transcript_99187/g.170799  ORF Transcript_99187/g.170799 Transcript_99187/m.170799 type:complete len:236 (-) Transcript_99187:500-1207(-)
MEYSQLGYTIEAWTRSCKFSRAGVVVALLYHLSVLTANMALTMVMTNVDSKVMETLPHEGISTEDWLALLVVSLYTFELVSHLCAFGCRVSDFWNLTSNKVQCLLFVALCISLALYEGAEHFNKVLSVSSCRLVVAALMASGMWQLTRLWEVCCNGLSHRTPQDMDIDDVYFEPQSDGSLPTTPTWGFSGIWGSSFKHQPNAANGDTSPSVRDSEILRLNQSFSNIKRYDSLGSE